MSWSSVLEPLPHMCETPGSVFSINIKFNWSEKYITSSVLWMHWVSHSWSTHCTDEQAKIFSGTYRWVRGFSGFQKKGTFSMSHEHLWITGPESDLHLRKNKKGGFLNFVTDWTIYPHVHSLPKVPFQTFSWSEVDLFCLFIFNRF